MQASSILLILVSVALSAGSQVILKLGMMSSAVQGALLKGSLRDACLTIALSPLIILGMACFGLSAVAWLFVLSRIPLSSAYPFVSLGILVTVLAGYFFFHEPISALKGGGVVLILVGIIMVGKGV